MRREVRKQVGRWLRNKRRLSQEKNVESLISFLGAFYKK